MELAQLEKISKALADASRLKILYYMAGLKDYCAHCSEIVSMVKLAQPSVSHHLKTLLEADLVSLEKEGRNHLYTVNRAVLHAYAAQINRIAR
ncbi:MAG: winged helix-turn-helix transcriptional regulator [Chitinophagaceae bacterium]|nr:winged helix-turn-helix transcriptional regulator [Chitinophagaceae bacterium]